MICRLLAMRCCISTQQHGAFAQQFVLLHQQRHDLPLGAAGLGDVLDGQQDAGVLVLFVVDELDVEHQAARFLIRPHQVDVVGAGVQAVGQRAVQQVAQGRYVPLAVAELRSAAGRRPLPGEISNAVQKDLLAESTRRSPSISSSGRWEVLISARARLTVDFVGAADDVESICDTLGDPEAREARPSGLLPVMETPQGLNRLRNSCSTSTVPVNQRLRPMRFENHCSGFASKFRDRRSINSTSLALWKTVLRPCREPLPWGCV